MLKQLPELLALTRLADVVISGREEKIHLLRSETNKICWWFWISVKWSVQEMIVFQSRILYFIQNTFERKLTNKAATCTYLCCIFATKFRFKLEGENWGEKFCACETKLYFNLSKDIPKSCVQKSKSVSKVLMCCDEFTRSLRSGPLRRLRSLPPTSGSFRWCRLLLVRDSKRIKNE